MPQKRKTITVAGYELCDQYSFKSLAHLFDELAETLERALDAVRPGFAAADADEILVPLLGRENRPRADADLLDHGAAVQLQRIHRLRQLEPQHEAALRARHLGAFRE